MFTYTFEYALQHGINVYSKFWNKYLVDEVSRYVDKPEYQWIFVNTCEYRWIQMIGIHMFPPWFEYIQSI